jgi:hypothetical protein
LGVAPFLGSTSIGYLSAMSWLPDLDSVCQALAGSLPVAEEVVVDGGSSADAGGSLFIHPVVPKNARQRAALHWLDDA